MRMKEGQMNTGQTLKTTKKQTRENQIKNGGQNISKITQGMNMAAENETENNQHLIPFSKNVTKEEKESHDVNHLLFFKKIIPAYLSTRNKITSTEPGLFTKQQGAQVC